MKNKYIRRVHVSEQKFRGILRLFCADVTALAVSKLVGLSAQSTQLLYDRFRLRILDLAVEEAKQFLARSKWTNRSEAEIDEVKATSEHDECEANEGVA